MPTRLIPYFGKFQPQLYIRSNMKVVGEKRDILVDFKDRRDIELDEKLMVSGKVRFIITGNYEKVDDVEVFDTISDRPHQDQLICVWWKTPEIGFCHENLLGELRIRNEKSHSGNSGYDYIIMKKEVSIESSSGVLDE